MASNPSLSRMTVAQILVPFLCATLLLCLGHGTSYYFSWLSSLEDLQWFNTDGLFLSDQNSWEMLTKTTFSTYCWKEAISCRWLIWCTNSIALVELVKAHGIDSIASLLNLWNINYPRAPSRTTHLLKTSLSKLGSSSSPIVMIRKSFQVWMSTRHSLN